MRTTLLVLQTIVSIVLIVVVLMQPSKTNGLSGLMSGGAAESFYARNKSRTSEALLVRITVVCNILFAVLVLAQNLMGK